MSTRALIGIKKGNKGETIYLQHSEEPNEMLDILESYKTEEKVRKLIDLGDCSVIGRKLNPTSKKHSFETPEEDVTVAYARDRGEEKMEARPFYNLKDLREQAKNSLAEYTFVFDADNKTWLAEEIYD